MTSFAIYTLTPSTYLDSNDGEWHGEITVDIDWSVDDPAGVTLSEETNTDVKVTIGATCQQASITLRATAHDYPTVTASKVITINPYLGDLGDIGGENELDVPEE